MKRLERELLDLICTTCNLVDVELKDVDSHTPIIGTDSPLGIDSIDALEIAVTVQQNDGVRMNSENTSRVVMQSLATLARYIEEKGA